ncbi:adenosylmethionine decarboxylase [Pyrofollis japonicus]|nr:adenosylmethionine decarboxylase [Pyrofollis japonicus]
MAQLVSKMQADGTEKGNEDFIIGRHVYGNLYGVKRELLENEDFLRKLVVDAAKAGDMHLVDLKVWKFQGHHGGVSVIALVLESHVSIHTWPDYGYATVDVYTCGERGDPWKAFNYIVARLRPRKYRVHYADRSSISEEDASETATAIS